jgi:hypothetical protein
MAAWGSAPEVYERYLIPAIFGPWAPIVIAQAKLQAGERVLAVLYGPATGVTRDPAGGGPRGTPCGVGGACHWA